MGGSDPEELWAAESRQFRGRSRPSECFTRVHMSPPFLTHLLAFEDLGFLFEVTYEVTLVLPDLVSPSRHPNS